MDAAEHGDVVLSFILGPGGVRALDAATRHVTGEHFEDRVQRALWTLAHRYADQTRGVITRRALDDYLRAKAPGSALQYAEYYDKLTAARPSAADFRHSLQQLKELKQEAATGEALAQAMEILRGGARDERGNELRGHADARAYALAAFADLERQAAAGQAPEGDMRSGTARMLERYARAHALRQAGRAVGVSTGLARLDDALSGGLANGEFALLIGWTSAGKSQFVAHLCWHAVVELRKNVVLFASETTRDNMETRIAGRHSRLPQFGLGRGLNTRDIRNGGLTEDEYRAYRDVLADYRSGPYGSCYVVQVPRGFTVGWIEARLAAVSRQLDPDLCVIDYLGLASPERHRKDKREELGMILQDAKQLAVGFSDGRGIPIVSPWQVNREGRKAVRERGRYSLADLSETAEAANTPDIVMSLLEPEEDTSRGRAVPLKLDVIKNRENERYVRLDLLADFATSHFQVREEADGAGYLDDEEELWRAGTISPRQTPLT